jgi:hypothetical protein
MNDVVVQSWTELNDALFAGSLRPALGRHRSPYAFRGQCMAKAGLQTGLMRLGLGFERIEAPILRAFRRYGRADPGALGIGDSTWNWLALAQHHGLPTRLLDFTYSPFVALHFATRSALATGSAASVWCVDYRGVAEFLPDCLRVALDQEGADVFTVEMLDANVPTLTALETLSKEPFAVFLEPPSVDARIVNQYALFTTMSDCRVRLDDWLETSAPQLVKQVVIPTELVWEVRDKLDQANINERVLFPGLDGLSQWLRRYYQPLRALEQT